MFRRKFKVVDNEFNRAWYKDLIGQLFDNPPGYAAVKLILVIVAPAQVTNG